MPGESYKPAAGVFSIVYHASYINSARTIIHGGARSLRRGRKGENLYRWERNIPDYSSDPTHCDFRNIRDGEREYKSSFALSRTAVF